MSQHEHQVEPSLDFWGALGKNNLGVPSKPLVPSDSFAWKPVLLLGPWARRWGPGREGGAPGAAPDLPSGRDGSATKCVHI